MFVIAIILLLTYAFATCLNPCQTPNGQEGDCIPINQCTPIYELFQTQGSLTSSATFLRQSKCGLDRNGYPKVCCALGSALPPKPANLSIRLLPEKFHCGTTVAERIWGGQRTGIDEFPWMALLEYQTSDGNRALGCGGVLINSRYVLTARHCVTEKLMSVRLGEWNTTSDPDCIRSKYGEDCAPKFLRVDVEEQIPYTDKTSAKNDIALLRLSQDVKFSEFIKPICLPTTPDLLARPHTGDQLVVAGWGMTEKEKPSAVKLKVLVPVKTLSECRSGLRQVFHVDFNLHEGQICAGGERGKDSCNGDSGGPLMYLSTTEWYALGIVSFGPNNPCGQQDRPAVYVRVAKYMRWILDNIKP